MQRDHVGDAKQLVEASYRLHAELPHPFRGEERVVGDDVHREASRAASDLLPDTPEAHEPERLVSKLDPTEARALPAPLLQRGVRLRDRADQGEQQPDRVLGSRDDGRLWSVDDDDPALRRG